MLSAEHFALENQAVKELLAIREREIQFFADRFNAIAMQASIVAGFVVSSMSSIQLNQVQKGEALESVFMISGSMCIVTSLYAILCTTMAGIWGSNLSLRGPAGSVTTAWHVLRSEGQQVMLSYITSILAFSVHCVSIFYLIDQDRDNFNSHVGVAITVFGVLLIFIKLFYINKKLRFDSTHNVLDEATITGVDLSSGSNNRNGQQERNQALGSMKVPLLNSKDGAHYSKIDVADLHEHDATSRRETSKFQHEGYMYKLGKRFGKKKRYFILNGSKLYGFTNKDVSDKMLKECKYNMTELEQKADNENINGTGLKIISLTGYQVMVPTNNLGNVYPISLVSINEADKRGNKYFRVDSAASQKKWLSAFVMASLLK